MFLYIFILILFIYYIIMDEFLTEHYAIHKDKLENYVYINNDNLDILKTGGKIKYIDLNGNLQYGGILIKIIDMHMLTTLKFLLKSSNYFYTLLYSKYYIFFEPVVKKKELKRKIFSELLTEFNK
jgi:hypothetical protein